MIATTRRMAIHDFLLVAMATLVIVLSQWPTNRKRQSVDLRSLDGTTQRYSLAIDDPRLTKLQRDLETWNRGGTNTAIALTKWRVELAEFYVNHFQSPQSADVAQVSFIEPGDTTNGQAVENPQLAAHDHWQSYWSEVGTQARESLAIQKAKLQDQRAITGPPIVFGKVIESRSTNTFLISCTCGCLMAILFGIWTHFSPSLGLKDDSDSSESDAQHAGLTGFRDRSSAELQLRIPSAWVRVHQPISVKLRRALYACLVSAALLCMLF